MGSPPHPVAPCALPNHESHIHWLVVTILHYAKPTHNYTSAAGIQNVLLLLLGLPTYLAAIQPDTSLSPSDIGLAATALVTLALEFVADNQQYAFQTFKHGIETYDESKQWPGARLNWTTADAKRGFITRGLWAYSRHPNFACEQTFWVSFCMHCFGSGYLTDIISGLSPSSPSCRALRRLSRTFRSLIFARLLSRTSHPKSSSP